MKWTPKYTKKFYWHRWFAWRPVQLNSGLMLWCEWVFRKKKCDFGNCYWEYSDMHEIELKLNKYGRCEKHGRILLHNGKCHDCRNEEVIANFKLN